MLDNRLMTISNMVTKKGTLLDVGTDHGYLPVYLIKNNLIDNAIASDVSMGSLGKAIKVVKEENLSEKISTRHGSGLNVIKIGDSIDTVVIAGMGGILISQLIGEKLEYVMRNNIEFIVQPVQQPEVIREFFYKNGFEITQETITKAESKIYHVIKAKYTGESIMLPIIKFDGSKVPDEIGYEIGINNIKSNDENTRLILKELIGYRKREQNIIKKRMEDAGKGPGDKRYNQVMSKINGFNLILKNI